ncbi:MAG: caspase family protein [Chitinophagaceae bacterium]|nr:caspase family protein [Chitinophagaceae bacterium]
MCNHYRISQYKLVPSLQFAHKDAQAFEDFLLSDAGGKVPKANIETFLNENANKNNVADAISIIARKAKPGDRVYFFFAGHGDMEDLTQIENGLLLLYNSPHGNYFGMKDDVLEILDLKRYLSPLSQRGTEMIFVVDACHSGNLKGGCRRCAANSSSSLICILGKEYKFFLVSPTNFR